LLGRAVFVSASIPDPDRWEGPFDALEITDAVVAIARAVLAAGGRLVTAAHPTIAPLILYVAAEQPPLGTPTVTVYQSEVFDGSMPEAISRFRDEGVGLVIRTPRIADEPPDPRRAPQSLAVMRDRMFADPTLTAAVFIGGMTGIPREHALFSQAHPTAPMYALGRPGGEARSLVEASPSEMRYMLSAGNVYPAIARSIVTHIAGGG
jgi:hypothetical protein